MKTPGEVLRLFGSVLGVGSGAEEHRGAAAAAGTVLGSYAEGAGTPSSRPGLTRYATDPHCR